MKEHIYTDEDLKTDLNYFEEYGINKKEAEAYIRFLLNCENGLKNTK